VSVPADTLGACDIADLRELARRPLPRGVFEFMDRGNGGEVALASAAAAGIPFTLATGSMTAMERVAEGAGGTLWFQIYMWPDRSASHGLIERAKAAGYRALVVTVDTPVPPGREYNLRSGVTVPFRFTRRNVTDVLAHPRGLATVLLR
jgi:isopentenyl diphosphate isomerase/L-lactate dehydrogenase-like FMN-dependent dehydrogenase